MAEVETRTQEKAAGATTPDQATVKGDIVNFLLYLKNQQYPNNTIQLYAYVLNTFLRRNINLLDPEAVKRHVSNLDHSQNTKTLKLCVYGRFLKWKRIAWERPRLSWEETEPFLPQINEVEQIIAGSGWKNKPFLQLLWECALRSVEANNLLWEEIDHINHTVRIRPRKRGKPRTLKISSQCLKMLMKLPRTNPKVFGGTTLSSRRRTFDDTRKRLSQQLGNPRLMQIRFHTLRHLRATIWYLSGVDLKTLQYRLGHKSIIHTFRYVHLAETLQPNITHQYHTRITNTIKEGEKLAQQGFELVGQDQTGCLWRKRKTYEDTLKELNSKTENFADKNI